MSKKTLKKEELQELLQRTQANFDNYRKQTEKRIQEIQTFASANLIAQLLPILDNFELALKHEINKEGIQLIHQQFTNLLENNGVQTIPTENETFNPYFHEALMKENSDLPENTIVAELQQGFTLQGKVIRHAKVKLSAGSKLEENKVNNEDTNENNNQTEE